MDSSSNLIHHTKDVPKQCQTFLDRKHPSSHRTASFSSSSSSLESFYFVDDPLLSPASPLRFSGVPFSWEHLPGIPKKHVHSNKNQHKSSMKLLPLPPPTMSHEDTKICKKNSIQSSFQRDPFFDAMVKCSKDDDVNEDHEEEISGNLWNSNHNGAKVSRSISDRFGFISLYGSCKRTCEVSESLVLLPISRKRSTYQQVNGKSL